jgi:transposase
MDNFIGIDAHSKTCTFVNLDKDGNMKSQGKFSTSERNLYDLVKKKVKGETAIIIEETNIAHWLYCFLEDKVDKIVICHPAYLPKKSGPKNDFRDAVHLAHQLRTNNYTSVYHEDNPLMNLRAMMTAYENVTIQGARLKEQFKALLRSQGITTESAHRTVSNPDKWKEFKTPAKKFVAEKLYHQIIANEEIKKDYMRQFRINVLEDKIIKNLTTIPGVGPVRAHIIAAYISSPARFETKYKLWSYSMLIRHKDESDGYIIKKRTPHGRKELKCAFMGAAQRIVISKSMTGLKEYYLYCLQRRNLNEKKARKSLARKIAAITLVIMKKGTKYDDNLIRKSILL